MSARCRSLALCVGFFLTVLGCDDQSVGPNLDTDDGGQRIQQYCPGTNILLDVESCDGIDNDCDRLIDEDFSFEDDPENCGTCGQTCDFDNGTALCRLGLCELAACNEGFFDVDGEPENGCERRCDAPPVAETCNDVDDDCDDDVDEVFDKRVDITNCGACGVECIYLNGDAVCDEGVCRLARCQPGFGDLDGNPENGCESNCLPINPGPEVCDGEDNDCDGLLDEGFDLDFDGENCGACGNRCSIAHAAGACREGACVLVSCEQGHVDADGLIENGCETLCEPTNDRIETCDEIDNDCNGIVDDGVNKEDDPENCGGCGQQDERFVCRRPNAEVSCIAGNCEIINCLPGFSNADGDEFNGCELPCVPSNEGIEVCDQSDNDCDGAIDEGFDIRGDAANCGGCNIVCETPGAVPGCINGRCVVAECPEGQIDADMNPFNGCEYACVPTDPPREVCDTVDNDCDARTDEGYDIFNDIEHCGACNTVCETENAIPVCTGGRCDIGGCDEGWVDADGAIDTGCELNCEPSPAGFEQCNGIDDDCDAEADEDFDFDSDPNHCGGCDIRCLAPNRQVACNAGACELLDCRRGWHDLNGNEEDGCEYRCDPLPDGELCNGQDDDCDGQADENFDLSSELAHCGACNTACARPNGIAACTDGACRLVACVDGFEDINQDPTDGCEARCTPSMDGEICNALDDDCDGRIDEDFDLRTDVLHCGECGIDCFIENGRPLCNGGVCNVLSCNPGFINLNGDVADGCECALSNGGVEICDGIDNDCNGVIDDPRRLAPPDDVQCLVRGICRDTLPTCLDGTWGCRYGVGYENDEESCDNQDNDCDGQIDEPFPTLGRPCAAGVGACRGIGEITCRGRRSTSCSAVATPERENDETCNDTDDDCDGRVDEDSQALVSIPRQGGQAAYRIFTYEASRPDSAENDRGSSFARACSKPSSLPWNNVDYATAQAACRALGRNWDLCSAEQWSMSCGGPDGQSYPYGDAYAANLCNGNDFDTDPNTPGNQDGSIPSGNLDECIRLWDEPVYDLSGNLWEWTNDDLGTEGVARALRGGSYGNIAPGLTCQFSLAAPPNSFRENVGFRCCGPAE